MKIEIGKRMQQMFYSSYALEVMATFLYLSKIIAFLLFHVTLGSIKFRSTLWGIKFRGQSRWISGQVICIWLQPAATFTPTPDSKTSRPSNK